MPKARQLLPVGPSSFMRITRLWAWCQLLLVAGTTTAYGQRVTEYQAEAGTLISSGQTPFWLRANQYGTVPLTNPVLRLSAGVHSDYRPTDSSGYRRLFDWGYGVAVVGNAGKSTQLLLPEVYLKGRLGPFELYAGRRRELVGLVDTLLTTGAFIWSGNALPMPKIQIGIPTYTAIPFTKGILSFMGAYAHGWFENSGRLVTGSFLHQKYLYGRIGKPSWTVRVYGGITHQVVWAGYSKLLHSSVAVNGRLPSELKYYPSVVLATRNGIAPNDPNITSFEENRIGNHLGTMEGAIEVDLKKWSILAYRQFIYDDGSLLRGTNLRDGLNGLRLKNRRQPTESLFFLRQLTFEFLFTGNQGGDIFILDDNKRRGRDDYFNHSQFIDGWTYYGRTIGSPFLPPQAEVRESIPVRNGIANNRMSVFHVGLSGLVLNKVDVITRLSFSRNIGTYPTPFPEVINQFSGALTASLPLNVLGGVSLNGSVALDVGGLLPTSAGVYVGLRKTGLLRRVQVNTPRGFN